MERCSLSGRLPPGWAIDMTELQVLSLSSNYLTGPIIPDAWTAAGSFPQLQRLSLSQNYFVGTLPGKGHVIPEPDLLNLHTAWRPNS